MELLYIHIMICIFLSSEDFHVGATDCPQYDGNESKCNANQCTWCPCTHQCVIKRPQFSRPCETGCSSFCGRKKECVEHGCIFDSRQSRCYDYALDTGIDFRAMCSVGDCSKNECQSLGCAFCKINQTCVPPALSKGCDPGCTTHCNSFEECTAAGCIYDHDSGDCRSRKSKRKRYAANVCGEETITPSGYWYHQADNSTFTVLSDDTHNDCHCNEALVSSHPEKELYRCEFIFPEVLIPIPIREAGTFILGLHVIENYKLTNRKEDIFVNEILVIPALDFDALGPVGTTHVEKVMIVINCALTEVMFKGSKMPIVNKKLDLRIKVIPRLPGDTIHAVLSAYYLEKIDD